jgi:hypothetical protein
MVIHLLGHCVGFNFDFDQKTQYSYTSAFLIRCFPCEASWCTCSIRSFEGIERLQEELCPRMWRFRLQNYLRDFD